MSNEPRSDPTTRTALQVACDTEVSGCVFLMRTEPDDRDQLLEITREHVAAQHGQEYSTEEIDEQHVEEVEVEVGEATS